MIAETNRDLQQTLLGFFLAVDAMLGPGYCFQTLLLHFILAIRAHAVFIDLNAFQRRIDHVQNRAVCIGHPEEKFLRAGHRNVE